MQYYYKPLYSLKPGGLAIETAVIRDPGLADTVRRGRALASQDRLKQ